MALLKNLAVGFLSFLLFLSLSIFGLAFTVNGTVLNPDFVTSELDRLEITPLLEESIRIESPPEIPDLDKQIYQAVSDVEPLVKEQLNSAVRSVYDYLLGETSQPELKAILKDTFFKPDFVAALVENIDVAPLVAPYITQQFAAAIPIEINNLDVYVLEAVTAAEPALKEQIIGVSGTVFDYLLMDTPTLEATISLVEIRESLKDKLLQALMDSPPPELAAIPPALREQFFNLFYQEFADQLPSGLPLDESLIGKDVPADIADGIATAEELLKQARQYINIFQTVYIVLIIFMVLLALGIILIIRNVKDVCRLLGTPLLIYGIIGYAGIWLGKYFSSGQQFASDLPGGLELWLSRFFENVLKPLEIFSLGLIIAGAILIVISFVYRRDDASI